MTPIAKYGVQVKKVYDGLRDSKMRARILLDELYEIDELSARDWKEVYLTLLEHLTELRERWQVLAVIYRAIELRSDFIIANRVVGKFLKNFDVLFEKLPGRPAYFIPSEYGRWLFESLINPFERAEVKEVEKRQVATVQQLSLISFLRTPKGVGA